MQKSRLIKVLLTVFIIAGGATILVVSSFGDRSYYKMVDELMVKPDKYADRTLKVHGYVEAGSIEEEIVDQTMHRTFVLENKGQRIEVFHTGPKPDTFKDLSEVVAEGKIVQQDGRYVLEATNLMAKCPSKYEGAAQNKNLGQSQSVF